MFTLREEILTGLNFGGLEKNLHLAGEYFGRYWRFLNKFPNSAEVCSRQNFVISKSTKKFCQFLRMVNPAQPAQSLLEKRKTLCLLQKIFGRIILSSGENTSISNILGNTRVYLFLFLYVT